MFKSKKDQTTNSTNTGEGKKENILTKQIKLKPAQIVIGITTIAIVLFAFILALSSFLTQSNKKLNKENIELNPELARAMTYEQFTDGSDAVEGTENVKFSAFFLRDLDGDGYAEKLKGTCKEVGTSDTLYMEINVLTAGRLNNAKIEIDGKNFYLSTVLPRDGQIKNTTIGTNTKKIEFNSLLNGTQKLLTGSVCSGDYTATNGKTAAIGNNINNYSRNDNKIVLTGTYVDENGNETEIRKEIPLIMDWYGDTKTIITNTNQSYYNISNKVDENKGTIELSFDITTRETEEKLLLSNNHIEVTIPEFNGYKASSVELTNTNDDYAWDENTSKLVIERIAETDETGKLTKTLGRENLYTVKVQYPIAAYEEMSNESEELLIPIQEYYEGYNNTNNEFNNPYKSNVAKSILRTVYYKGIVGIDQLSVTIGKYTSNPYYDYVISKAKPMRIYKGQSSEEHDDNYLVRWYYYKGNTEENETIILKENSTDELRRVDNFLDTNGTYTSMEEVTTNKGIYFENLTNVLGEEGELKVYDDITNELLLTVTKDNFKKYTESNPYKYQNSVKHIRVEIDGMKQNNYIYIYNIKELDDEYITNTYSEEEFRNLKQIRTTLQGTKGGRTIGIVSRNALYELPISVARIEISKSGISTQEKELNNIITVTAENNTSANEVGWRNGIFLIKLPNEILETEINGVTIDDSSVKVTAYEYYENAKGKFIRIYTSNNTPQGFILRINVNLTADPRIPTIKRNLELYAANEEETDYYYKARDSYDLNDNLNTEEMVNKTTCEISMVAPNSLLTNQTLSEFDEEGTVIVSPSIAEISPKVVGVDNEEKTVKIGVQITNNYSSDISEVVLIGKIPFEGNTSVLTNYDLGSSFTTRMLDRGIEVPSQLQGKVDVYYSTNENPSKDLTDTNNNWEKAEQVTNWTQVRTFLIDFKEATLSPTEEEIFYYYVAIPNGLNYNIASYSQHGVWFALNTDEGKYRTQTEPTKTGIRIAEKYGLELTKYQKEKAKKISGATYRIAEVKENNGYGTIKTEVTSVEGKIDFAGLYVEQEYEIKEIKTPDEYELNEDAIRFICHVNGEGELEVEKISGTTKGDMTVIRDNEENQKVTVDVEDEALARVKIIKQEQGTGVLIRGTIFKITGGGLPESGRVAKTNTNGEAILKGLQVGEEYTLEETKATEGYYLNKTIVKFTIVNNNGIYEINVTEGTPRQTNITTEEEIPTANIILDNEKIPTYDLEMTKIKHIKKLEGNNETGSQTPEEETTYLAGAKFKLYKNGKELGEYITDENGKLTITGLYQYVEEKEVEQTYVLKEVLPPEGYAKVKDIVFSVKMVDKEWKTTDTETGETTTEIIPELEFNETLEEGQSAKEYTSDANKINITVEDTPSFKLIKKDGETGEVLPNTKFAIYNTDEGTRPATNSKGEIIGTKETINGKEYYTVTTDENGEITLDLPEGLYKAVEVEAEEKYDISKNTEYFGIGASREGIKGIETEFGESIGSSSDDYIYSVAETLDGGYIVGGYFLSSINLGNEQMINSNGSYDGMLIKYSQDGEVEWGVSIGGSSNDYINSVAETEDGGYIVGGYFARSIELGNGQTLNSNGVADGMLIKYSIDGDVEWGVSIGGSKDDYINSVVETEDGDYIIGGYFISGSIDLGNGQTLNNNGREDGMLIKYSRDGECEWGKSIGGYYDDRINSITETEDGEYIVGGYFTGSNSNIDLGNGQRIKGVGSSRNGMLIKYSQDGECKWGKCIGGRSTSDLIYDNISSVSKTEDGGCIVGGHIRSSIIDLGNGKMIFRNSNNFDGILIKYSRDGECEWAINIGENSSNEIQSVLETTDGNYIVGGYFLSSINLGNEQMINSNGRYDGMLIKYKKVEVAEGVIKNGVSIGGSNTDEIKSLSKTTDGGYIVGGNFQNSIDLGNGKMLISHGSSDVMLIKHDRDREVEWGVSIGGSFDDEIISVSETTDEGYIVAGKFKNNIELENGQTIRNTTSRDVILIKYSRDGEVEYGINLQVGYSYIQSVAETADGGYIVGGYFDNNLKLRNGQTLNSNGMCDGMIIKYSRSGDVEWGAGIGGSRADYILTVSESADGGYIVGGHFASSILDLGNGQTLNEHGSTTDTDYDGMIIKYSRDGDVEWGTSTGGNGEDYIDSVSETSDGGYIVGGYFFSDSIDLGNGKMISKNGTNNSDGLLIKYSRDGECEWGVSIGSDISERIKTVLETADGGYIVGGLFSSIEVPLRNGQTISNHENSSRTDGMLIKCNRNGEIEWGVSIGGNGNDGINSVIETIEGYYIIGGYFVSSIDLGNGKNISSHGSQDGMIINVYEQKGVPEQEEVTIENYRKEYKITTDVEEIEKIKGGSISGEDLKAYEKVKYGDNSTKEVVMNPNENYEIIRITVNGEEWPFEKNIDGTYTMPQFSNMTEDKHIIVKYALKDNKITINKVDNRTNEPIEGVRFKLDQIEERTNPDNSTIIGNLTDNGQPSTVTQVSNNEITTALGTMTNNNTYYFVQNEDGTIVPTNSKTYQLANGGTAGIQSTTANSYIPIDLSGLTGKYAVVVNARVLSESADYGYATLNQSMTAPAYNTSTGRFMYISGTKANSDYISTTMNGGETYYLHLGYRKDGSVDTNEDQVVINSIKIYELEEINKTFNFNNNEGKYESTNQNEDNTTCNSYIPIDLREYAGKYNLTVNAEILTVSGDYGYATIVQGDTPGTSPAYNSNTTTNRRFIYITEPQEAKDYTIELDGGYNYFLHLGYYKDGTTNPLGQDKFTVNSVQVSLSDSELYHAEVVTNSEGQAVTQIPFGKYELTEMNVPEGYETPETLSQIIEFRSDDGSQHEFTITNRKLSKVIVHHYIKGTTTKVAEDEEQLGKIGEEYTTLPKTDLEKYELEKDALGEYIIPTNAKGQFEEDEIEVTYYYVKKPSELIVHHYIIDEETPVPLANGSPAEDVITYAEEGTEYTTSAITEDLLAEDYELAITPENANGEYSEEPIVVTYYYKKIERNVVINKYGGDSTTPLEGAKFIVNTTGDYNIIDVGEMTNNGTYYFVKNGGKYVPNNQGKSATANSYIKIDMTKALRPSTVTVNAEVSSRSGYDYGYATINQSTTAPLYSTNDATNNRFIYISGNVEAQDYTTTLEVGKVYYLHFGYRKYSSISAGTDTFIINSIKIEGAEKIYTTNAGGQIELTLESGTYKVTEIEAPNGYETLSSIEDIIINKDTTDAEINLRDAKKKGRVIVHHYEEGTDTPIEIADGVYATDESKEGEIGEIYATKPIENLLPKYEVVDENPEKASGEYIDGTIEVTYYYKKIPATVKVYHYIEGTTTPVPLSSGEDAQEETINGYVGEDYTTSEADIDSKYELVETPTNAEGTMTADEIEVIYYYKIKDTSVLVHYYIEGTTDEVPLSGGGTAQDVTIDGKIDDNYSTVPAENVSSEYELIEIPTTATGIMTEDQIVVIYYYRLKDSSVIVHHYLVDGEGNETTNRVKDSQGVEIPDETQEGKVGDDYTTSASSEIASKYELVTSKMPSNAEGTMTEDQIVVIYYYKLKDTSVLVHHYVEGTTTNVPKQGGGQVADVTINGQVDDSYTTTEATDKATYYELVAEPSNKNGTMTEEQIVVTYYYKLKKYPYVVNYLEEGTNRRLSPQKQGEEQEWGTEISTDNEVIVIDGYKLVGRDVNGDESEDILTISEHENDNVINIYYAKRNDLSYTVYYKEKDTNRTLHDPKTEGNQVFGTEITSSNEIIDIDGYTYDSVDKDSLTITTGTNEITIYYTKRTDLPYTVHYKEKDSGDTLHNDKNVTGRTYGEVITSSDEVMDINGYYYDSVDKETLTIGTGTNEITIYYTKRTDLPYTVHYVEKGTNAELHEDKVTENQTFGTVITSSEEVIDIEGYNYDSVDKATLTIGTGTNEITIYYTKKNDLSYAVHYKEKGTNAELHEDKVTENQTFGTVITSSNEVIDIEGYNYDSVDKDNLTIGTGTNEITIYYTKKNDLSYTVNYLEKGTNTVLHESKTQGNMTYKDIVRASDEVIAITGYNYDSCDKNQISIEVDSTRNVINLYYTKITGLAYTVNYLEKGTDEPIHAPKVEDNKTYGDVITTSNEVILIDGYNYDSVDKDSLTITTDNNQNVINIYYTKKNDLSYTVHYKEKGTNEELHEDKVTENQTFGTVITSSDEIISINGYNYDSVDKATLTIGTGTNEITVYYIKRNDLPYTVHYLEKGTNVELHDDKVVTGKTYGEIIESNTEVIDIDGYNYDSVDKNQLVIGTGTNEITVYYTKKNDLSYTVHYKEKDKNSILHEDKVVENQTFGTVITSSDEVISIDGYNYDSVDKETLTIGTGTNEITIWYTKRNDLSYVVHYVEKGTNEELHEDKVTGTQTFGTVITSSNEVIDIDGYNYDSVDKDSLTIGTGTNEITIYYTKRQDLPYRVKYLEKDTERPLHEEKIVNDAEFEETILARDEVITIPGYDFDSYDKEFITITTNPDENIITIYYTKKNGLSYTVNYLEKGTNAVLHEAKQQSGKTFEETVNASDEIIDITAYNYDSLDVNGDSSLDVLTISDNEENNVINIYYTRKPAKVIVHYYEEGTTNPVSEDVEKNGLVNDVYETEEATDIPSKYELVAEPSNKNGVYTEEPTEVIYYYRKKATKVIVHHLEDPEINGGLYVVLANDEEIPGKIDDNYTTTPSNNVPSKYEVVTSKLPANAEGTMTQDVIEVTYYYKVKDTSLVIKYVDRDTGEEISERGHQEGKVDERYRTDSKEVEGYTLVGDSGNTEGTLTEDEITVTYYYAKNTKVTVKYIDEDTGLEIREDDGSDSTEVINGKVGDEYTSVTKVFYGYTISRVPADAEGTMTREEKTIYYYYKKIPSGIIVNHIALVYREGEQQEDLLESYTQDGNVGENYTTSEKTYEGYDFIEERRPANANGRYTPEVQVINYYYIKQAKVIVKYVDKYTEEEIPNPDGTPSREEKDGHEGDPYTTERKVFDDYVLEEVPTNADGVMPGGTTEVIYVYKHISGGIIENHIDKLTGLQLVNEVKHEGYVGEDYTTSPKEFSNYDLVQEEYPENATGKFRVEEQRVTYYYIQKSSVTIRYIDRETNKDIPNPDGTPSKEELTGHVGDSYTSEAKPFEGYILEEVPENKEGTMKENPTTVIYYYRKIKFNLKVEKIIKTITVNGIEQEVNGDLGKAEVYRKEVAGQSIKVKYAIKVINDGELEGSAVIRETIPEGMTMNASTNGEWNISGSLATLETDIIVPGDEREYEVVLEWKNNGDNIGTKTNNASIVTTNNKYGFEETDTTDNEDTADLIIAVSTGDINYVFGAIGLLIILGGIALTFIKIDDKKKTAK